MEKEILIYDIKSLPSGETMETVKRRWKEEGIILYNSSMGNAPRIHKMIL